MKKNEIRQKIKAIRAVMDPEHVKTFSGVIKKKLLSLESVAGAGCIMAFYSYKNEPQMIEFMHECIDMGKRIALPRVTGEGKMIAVEYSPDTEMINNVYGIPEPIIRSNSKHERPDIVIVPGIAFDLGLNRIGFGGGYYDRFLEGTGAYKIGVCFDYQIIENLESDSHDVPMDIIVTEKRIIGEY
jgi:5-formyltetrahydrofolate cyclo-ligase